MAPGTVTTRTGPRQPARPPRALAGVRRRLSISGVVPFALLVAILVLIVVVEPQAATYDGMSLLLIGALPVAFATMAQLFVMAAGDIDLGIGAFVGLVNALVVVVLSEHGLTGALALAAAVLGYVAMGALITVRRIPSLTLTFGMASVWLGLAIVVLPTPGGTAPLFLITWLNTTTPVVPLPVIVLVVLAVVCQLLLFGTRLGVRLRAVGASPVAAARAGVPVLRMRLVLYALAGLMGVLAGLALSGQTGSGDANGAVTIVLTTVAAVIVGGGSFDGGDVNALGAVAGAVALGLLSSLLAFLNVSSDYTLGLQGVILIAAVGVRVGSRWAARLQHRHAPPARRPAGAEQEVERV